MDKKRGGEQKIKLCIVGHQKHRPGRIVEQRLEVVRHVGLVEPLLLQHTLTLTIGKEAADHE